MCDHTCFGTVSRQERLSVIGSNVHKMCVGNTCENDTVLGQH